jgi:RHS repeat-associated protein
VPQGWSGTVTPSATGYSFAPASRSYSSIGSNQAAQDYAATMVSTTAPMFFIHVDHLNTPRLVANQSGQTVWRWDQQEPFGNNPADENPSGLGAFDLPLRLPGQYYDKETNLSQNVRRDYDPLTGRYIQPEPLGLAGDINAYRYARNNSLAYVDRTGEAPEIQVPGSSTSFGISLSIPIYRLVGVGFGTGVTIRQCCSENGKVTNEWYWSVRGSAGVGGSFQPSASGRGVIPLVQVGGLPRCLPPTQDRFFGSVDIAAGVFGGRADLDSGTVNVGLSPGGIGASVMLNFFERTVVIAQRETEACCKPK